MSTLYIKTNTQGIILKSFIRQIDGLEVVLLNEHNVPLARYLFNNRSNIDYIEYKSNSSRIHFSLPPMMKYEIVSS